MPIKQKTIALRKTAFHEAGHAVEAVMLTVGFRSVSIRPEADTFGRVLFRKWPLWALPNSKTYDERRATDWLTRRTQISLAGQIAEAIHTGRRPARYSHAFDDDHALDNATCMCSSTEEVSLWLNWLFVRTRNQLQLPPVWHAVESLADELFKKETISGEEAREIIRAALFTPDR